MLKWQLRELSAPTLPLFTPLTGCLLSDKTSVLWLRPHRDASYLMFVSSIQLNGYFGHFHGILDGLRPAVGCCHGYAGCSSSGSLPGRVAADCKQNKSGYAAPCRPGSAQATVVPLDASFFHPLLLPWVSHVRQGSGWGGFRQRCSCGTL